jgi:uncharacterized phage protein (TIGR02216 family)
MRLSPETFWRMSLPEWRAAASAFAPKRTPLARAGLEDLMQRFPDKANP